MSMKTIKTATLFLLLLLSGGFALAQSGGGCYAGQVIAPPQPLGLGQPVPGAIVRVCSSTAAGSVCSPLTSGGVFSDPGLTDPIPNPLTADQNGNYNFCASQGSYLIQAFPDPATIYSFQVTVGIAPSGSYTFSGNNTFTGSNSFTNTNTFSAANLFSASNTFSANNIFSVPQTFTEGSCSGALTGADVLCASSSLHALESSLNNGSFVPIPQLAGDLGGTAASPTVAKIQGTVITGVTGSGAVVLANTPTLTTPNIGAATGTSINLSGSATIGGAANVSGNGATGNVAIKEASGDHTIYVSPTGSDLNDGLSWGSAKLTSQAAFNTATTTGTVAGTAIFAPGAYSCPVTWYSNMTVIGMGKQSSENFVGGFSGQNTPLSGTTFTCTSGPNHTIQSVSNLNVKDININFSNSGGGLVIKSVLASTFDHLGTQRAGSTTNPALLLQPGATGPTNNTAFNTFYNLTISATTTNGQAADCLQLAGTGTPNAGVSVTDNRFYGIICQGFLKNGLRLELNTDTNKFYGVELNNQGPAVGDALVINSNTPASDQDADNITVEDLCYTGTFNNALSMGASFGNIIQECGATEVVINTLGGSPALQNTVITTGLFGVAAVHAPAKLHIQNGVISGSGAKHQRFGASCTTAASANANCNTTLTWTVQFSDNNYTVNCTANGFLSGVPILQGVSHTASAVTATVIANSAVAAQFAGFDCIAFHDPQ